MHSTASAVPSALQNSISSTMPPTILERPMTKAASTSSASPGDLQTDVLNTTLASSHASLLAAAGLSSLDPHGSAAASLLNPMATSTMLSALMQQQNLYAQHQQVCHFSLCESYFFYQIFFTKKTNCSKLNYSFFMF